MGIPATPTDQERTATLGTAHAVVQAVENDEEGPLALPDFNSIKSWDGKVALLKSWWTEVDLQIFRISQDLCDNRASLEVACALLARGAASPVPAASEMATRLRRLDIPSQDEIDRFTAWTPAPTLDPRLLELLDRVTGTSGAVAATLSASEWHELRADLESFRYKATEPASAPVDQ